MTRREYSDSTLDALAQGRQPLEEQSLADLIEDHRALFRADVIFRIHDRDGESGIGPPFSGRFERYINWDDKDQALGVRPSRPGPTFAWSSAFWQQWVECRRSHPEHHDRPEWRGSLCRQLVAFTIRREYSLTDTCLVLGVTPPRAGRTLRNALLWIEGAIDRQRDRAQQEARRSEPYLPWSPPQPSHERHDQPGMHAADCPRCRKNGQAA